jgi:hypothetical protein
MDYNNYQQTTRTFSTHHVSDELIRETAAGAHQKLIRTEDGRRVLVVRIAHGIYDRIPVIEFDHAGVQA